MALLTLLGCEEKYPVYSSFDRDLNGSFPNCLHYTVNNATDKRILQESFGIEDDKSCLYRLALIRYHIGNCDNPRVKSIGSDFDGYVRVEIRKGFQTLYKVQSDFKHDENAAFERICKQIKCVSSSPRESHSKALTEP